MIILLPMGGRGQRFVDAGYKDNKPCIPTTYRLTGEKLPMVVCAIKDIPGVDDPKNTLICVDRDFHKQNGTEATIQQFFPRVSFIHDTELTGQATGVLVAREFIDNDEDLFIGPCDNGMVVDQAGFDAARETFDVLVISHTNDSNIAQNPLAHSWLELEQDGVTVKAIRIKQTVSDTPMNDHATTGMFWFKKGSDYVSLTDDMVAKKDMVNNEYYVDQVIQYAIDANLKVGYFDITYIGWGTPYDFEVYENTLDYWKKFSAAEPSLVKKI
ncbi:MAG: nucleotidyltransferase [Alphaproteobacteria bacterium]|nr:nucleotidyltransferase [Alphaproteobacteria bacterium]